MDGDSVKKASRAIRKMQKQTYVDMYAALDKELFKPHELAALQDIEDDEEEMTVDYKPKEAEKNSSSEEELPSPEKAPVQKKRPVPVFIPPIKKKVKSGDGAGAGASGISVPGIRAIDGPSTSGATGPVTGGAGDNGMENMEEGEGDKLEEGAVDMDEDSDHEVVEISENEGVRNLLMTIKETQIKNCQTVEKVRITPLLEQLVEDGLFPKKGWKSAKDKAHHLKKLIIKDIENYKNNSTVSEFLANEFTLEAVKKIIDEILTNNQLYAGGKQRRSFNGKGRGKKNLTAISSVGRSSGGRALHFGKLRGTRQTFNLAAKISSLVQFLGLFVQLDMYILEKTSREHAGSVCLVSYSALCAWSRLYSDSRLLFIDHVLQEIWLGKASPARLSAKRTGKMCREIVIVTQPLNSSRKEALGSHSRSPPTWMSAMATFWSAWGQLRQETKKTPVPHLPPQQKLREKRKWWNRAMPYRLTLRAFVT